MAYAIIPEGYTLQKVNKAEKAAVDAYFRHEDTKTLLGNVNTPLVVGGMITAFFGARLAGNIISDLEDKVGAVSQDIKDGITDTIAKGEKELLTDPQNWVAANLAGLISLGAKIPTLTDFRKAVVK
jgi:hypothetical protein